MRRGVSFSLHAAIWLFTLLIAHSHAKVVPYLQPGFSFAYDGPQQTVALPITAQCENIRLRWSRGKAKGPTPIAPYFLSVMSSSSASPYIIPAGSGPTFEWQVPFAPQTQYQICMFDNFGVSGGCQVMRTMVASPTNVTSCQNVTSLPALPVSTSLDDPNRLATQLPVISQCDSFSVSTHSGQPPYTLTIAPSRHPPVNISSTSRQIDWTVALPEGFPFFASLTSADGLFWTMGPLYVDGTGSSDCLAPGSIPKKTFTFSTIGSTMGSFIVGGVIGALGMLLFARCKQRKRRAVSSGIPSISKPTMIPELSHNYEPQIRPAPQPSIQYPPPSMEPESLSMPTTPERSNFLEQDPFAQSAPRNRGGDPYSSPSSSGRDSLPASSIVPFTDTTPTPTSSHFPLDVKSRRSTLQQHSRSPSRTPSLRSYTTFASTSDFNQSSYAPSTHNSLAPLMPSNGSTRSSRVSRLGRAPTYVRRAPTTTTLRSHLSVAEVLMDDDSMIGSGDQPPSYNRTPAEQEISITGGAL